MIVLSNGEKISPVAMEAALRDHPGVTDALIVGQGKFSTAAVLELTPDMAKTNTTPEDRAMFIESLWPYAEVANEKAPAHAQLSIDKLMIVPSEKPFLRAGKGTVQRSATVKLFESEIEELYQRTEQAKFLDVPNINLNLNSASLKNEIGDLIEKVTGIRLTEDQDFFSAGMDSLHVMQFAKYLRSAITGTTSLEKRINTRVLYTNPTLGMLTRALKAFHTNTKKDGDCLSETREDKMLEILQKYVDELPVWTEPTLCHQRKQQQQRTVILTGSTGSLGSYLLDALSNCPGVQKIYCLNRKADAESLQIDSNSRRGLVSEWGTKVDFLQADLSKWQLGLCKLCYETLAEETTLVVRK